MDLKNGLCETSGAGDNEEAAEPLALPFAAWRCLWNGLRVASGAGDATGGVGTFTLGGSGGAGGGGGGEEGVPVGGSGGGAGGGGAEVEKPGYLSETDS